jgi:hypothetical protein
MRPSLHGTYLLARCRPMLPRAKCCVDARDRDVKFAGLYVQRCRAHGA